MGSRTIKNFISAAIITIFLGGLISGAHAGGYKTNIQGKYAASSMKKWTTPAFSFIHTEGQLPGGSGKYHNRAVTSRANLGATVKTSGKVTSNKGIFSWKQKVRNFGIAKTTHYVQKDAQGNEMFRINSTEGKRKSTTKTINADGSRNIIKTWNTKTGMTFGIATDIAVDGTKSSYRFGHKTKEPAQAPLFLP